MRSTACGTATRNRSTRPEKKRDSPVVPPKSEVEPVPSEPGRGGGFSRPTVSRMKLLVEVNVVVDVLLDPVAPCGIECCDVAARETGLAAGFAAGTR